MNTLPVSKLVKSQFIRRTAKNVQIDGQVIPEVVITLRWDDQENRGFNTFYITCAYVNEFHDFQLIEAAFPEYKHLFKWDRTTSKEPINYIDMVLFWSTRGGLKQARNNAYWPDATLEQLQDVEQLKARLPAIMAEFKQVIKSLGFEY